MPQTFYYQEVLNFDMLNIFMWHFKNVNDCAVYGLVFLCLTNFTYTHIHTQYIYIYIYRERERERQIDRDRQIDIDRQIFRYLRNADI